jgi:MarR family transcriptional regulator, transcriptional regulator for hemolysin
LPVGPQHETLAWAKAFGAKRYFRLARYHSQLILSWLTKFADMQTDLENDYLLLLYDVARQMRTLADQMARTHGMTRAQWIILTRLERQPGLSQNELAAAAEVAPITIARLIDRLEALGLVERRPDPDDRRIWRLAITPRAKPYLREIDRNRADLRALITQDIDPQVLEAMRIGLRKMKDNLARGPSATRQARKKA